MTLHVVTITPNHIISVSDRLISRLSDSGTEFVEIDNDMDKQFILVTDEARMTISYAGFAGTSKSPKSTIKWLIDVIQNTSMRGIHNTKQHLGIIGDAVNKYISQFRGQGYPDEVLRLAIFASGWLNTKEYGELTYNYVIDNCLDPHHVWATKARPQFIHRHKLYVNEKFKEGFLTIFLGDDRLGQQQRSLLRVLEKYSEEDNPKMIFNSSVDLIRSAASASKGNIGYNCIGIRNSKGDNGLESYDSRTDSKPGGMPDFIKSTTALSMSLTDFKIIIPNS